jgi:hypothetical protein
LDAHCCRNWLAIGAVLAPLSGCMWLPTARIPADTEGVLVIRCREVHGWFDRDSHWMVMTWAWRKTEADAAPPGSFKVDDQCNWQVIRDANPALERARIEAPDAHPLGQPPPP